MQLHLNNKQSRPRHQHGAFLILALILLVVLAGLGVALLSETVSSLRVSKNYSKIAEAQVKADSMANYAKRILESYPDGKYPGPATCNSSGSCNGIVSAFPHSGRPTLVWTSGLGSATMIGPSEPNAWWTTNGFGYEGTFTGSGNARVVVARVGALTGYPYTQTYRVLGYGTDGTGTARTTSEMFHSWKGFLPDPNPGTCSGGCNYGDCCSSGGTCANDQSSCEGGTAAYVPPGWTCTEYFVTGKGYASSTCNNVISKIYDGLPLLDGLVEKVYNYYVANSAFPEKMSDLGYPNDNAVQSGIFSINIVEADTKHRIRLYVDVTPSGLNLSATGTMILDYRPTVVSDVVTFVPSYFLDNSSQYDYIPKPFDQCEWVDDNSC